VTPAVSTSSARPGEHTTSMQDKKTPAVSVVVPLYNKASYITRCLESICLQTFDDFEVLVVDDGSTDGSGEIAGRMPDHRIRVISQRNAGEGAARNRGIAEARAGLVAFLDADDAWEPGFLEAVIRLSQRYPEAGLFATGYRRLMDTGEVKDTTLAGCNDGGTRLVRDYFCIAIQGNFVTSSSVAVRSSVFQEIGTFAEGEPIGTDIDLWARIALRYPIGFDSRILAVYHSEAEGRSFHRWRSNPPYPPVVRSLRRYLAGSELDLNKTEAIRAFVDAKLLAYGYWLVDLRDRQHLKEFLKNERYETARGRFRVAVLRTAVRLLPLRVISAIRWRLGPRIPVHTPDIMSTTVHEFSAASESRQAVKFSAEQA
jgi:glycosyltransferase involved in cell wall biosynthesis